MDENCDDTPLGRAVKALPKHPKAREAVERLIAIGNDDYERDGRAASIAERRKAILKEIRAARQLIEIIKENDPWMAAFDLVASTAWQKPHSRTKPITAKEEMYPSLYDRAEVVKQLERIIIDRGEYLAEEAAKPLGPSITMRDRLLGGTFRQRLARSCHSLLVQIKAETTDKERIKREAKANRAVRRAAIEAAHKVGGCSLRELCWRCSTTPTRQRSGDGRTTQT